jgi:RNA polymerase primary sigma factor
MLDVAIRSETSLPLRDLINFNSGNQIDNFFYNSAKEQSRLFETSYLSKEQDDSLVDKMESSFLKIVFSENNPFVDKPKVTPRRDTYIDQVPSSLHAYHKSISKHEPMSREEELAAFTQYKRTRSKLRSAINKLPKEHKAALGKMHNVLHKNYATFKHQLTLLPDTYRQVFFDLLSEQEKLRNIIITKNLRFVIKVAKSFWKDKDIETFKTIISAGNIGLFTAIDKFDVKRDTRFLSYAAHWIALEIRLELANNYLVKVPLWWQKLVRKMAKAYEAANGKSMTTKELSEKTNIPEQYIKQVNNNQELVNGDNLYSNGICVDITNKQQYLTDEETDIEEHVARQDIRRKLQDFINALPTKEQGVIRLLFGLTPESQSRNLRQIGDSYNLSSERIRQIKESALETLRQNFKKINYTDLRDFYY